jgi:hypothetical protein
MHQWKRSLPREPVLSALRQPQVVQMPAALIHILPVLTKKMLPIAHRMTAKAVTLIVQAPTMTTQMNTVIVPLSKGKVSAHQMMGAQTMLTVMLIVSTPTTTALTPKALSLGCQMQNEKPVAVNTIWQQQTAVSAVQQSV